jgi:NAD(P)-dependent dehydrogenase (short-subunit alcohol dehydrogenase family)
MTNILALFLPLLLKPVRKLLKFFLLVGAGLTGVAAVRRLLQREADLSGNVVLITGARGLALLLAREFAREGCRIVLCARDREELQRAQADLSVRNAEVLTVVCDVSDQEQVRHLVRQARDRFGRIDILVNNAGIMDVGDLSAQTLDTFEQALDVMFWGVLYPTLEVLPQMRARHSGRIVNITSIGGKAAVPHLLPYSAAKFAAVGLSEGLRAELSGSGITVTTIVPGLMRTGSYLNAYFHGQRDKEFAWFALGASLPLISMDAGRAARQIVEATRRGEAERTLSLPAQLLARMQGLAPGFTTDLMGLVGRILQPAGVPANTARRRGLEIQQELPSRPKWLMERFTTLGRDAARRLNELSPADLAEMDTKEGATAPPARRQTRTRVWSMDNGEQAPSFKQNQ